MSGILRTMLFFHLLIIGQVLDNTCFAQRNDRIDKRPIKNGVRQREQQGDYNSRPPRMKDAKELFGNVVLGCPSDHAVTISFIAGENMDVFAEFGPNSGAFDFKTESIKSIREGPVEISFNNLQKNTKYYYRVSCRCEKDRICKTSPVYSFTTQRTPGSTFSFGVQGDSHPERAGKMFSPALYLQTMKNAVGSHPDFYFMMGDDFSIEKLIEKNQVNPESVDAVYLDQRQYVGLVGCSSPLFLVNGNHEQAAKYLLDGTPDNPAVLAAKSREKYYPLPATDRFYSGDDEQVQNIGLLKDYYAFEWGDALFVVIDPYWHSDSAVDNMAGKREKVKKDPWGITLGETQYRWFSQILKKSKAKFKFVFSHHVLGTGRGGTERANLFEWGGFNQKGAWEFDRMRPGWGMPIHQLMVKNKVSVFFQGHDHLFAKQELDGVIYQSVPNPADNTYTAFNADAYKSGDVFPNSGFLNITVSPDEVRVDYIRTFLSNDETNENKNGAAAFCYTFRSR